MRRSPLKRKTRIRPISAKQQRFNAEFNLSRVAVAKRSGGFCEARTSACTRFAEHFHHVNGRVGPGVNLPGMILHVCFRCHDFIHGHPLESYKEGWMLKRLGSAHDAAGDPSMGTSSIPGETRTPDPRHEEAS